MSLATFLGFSWHLQNVEPSMAKFYAIGQISIIVKRTKIEKQSNPFDKIMVHDVIIIVRTPEVPPM